MVQIIRQRSFTDPNQLFNMLQGKSLFQNIQNQAAREDALQRLTEGQAAPATGTPMGNLIQPPTVGGGLLDQTIGQMGQQAEANLAAAAGTPLGAAAGTPMSALGADPQALLADPNFREFVLRGQGGGTNLMNMLLRAQAGAGPGRQARFSKDTSFITEATDPETGDRFNILNTPVLNDLTGQIEIDQQRIGAELASRRGETTTEERQRQVLTTEQKEAAKISQALSQEAFQKIAPINEAIGLYDEALTALDQGADTGSIAARLPSIADVGIELDNIQSRLGLNVIRNTTFGSLSEAELQFALSSALPQDLSEDGLRDWLTRKKDAQTKLANYVRRAAKFLGKPGNTAVDWLELQEKEQAEREAKRREKEQAEPEATPAGQMNLQERSTDDIINDLFGEG